MDESPKLGIDEGTGEQPAQLIDLEYWPHLDLGNELFSVDWLDKIPQESEAPKFHCDKTVVTEPHATTDSRDVVDSLHAIQQRDEDDPKNDPEVRCCCC